MQTPPQKVLVGGCFDILHYGHVRFLELAKAQGTHLIIALESDDAILRGKKRHPIHTQEERAHILLALTCVDDVISLPLLSTYDDYLGVVKSIGPAVIATTSGDPQLNNKRMQAQTIGARLEIVIPLLEGFSSSRILALLEEEL
ncbi:MAG: glycerol-3-phosphate cytidylyltransferase [Candidatus Puniceispirillum sp.]|nr:glycerol-3-phosphate cytidylyltransferase [Candidatus Puniceispirillum sp.]